MFQKVTFYDNAGLGNTFECQFRSEKSFDGFISKYQNLGGALNFDYDIWEESQTKYDLPIISNTEKSFYEIMDILYKNQDSKIKEDVKRLNNRYME